MLQAKSTSLKTVDYSLLLSKLEKNILKGELTPKYSHILKQKNIWSNLNQDQALSWARLAQIAGDVQTSLEVLDWLNQTYPDFTLAWQEHWEILNTLGKTEQAIQLRAKAIKQYNLPASLFVSVSSSQPVSTDIDVEEPFAKYHLRQELLELFMRLFRGRENCFARQWVDKENKKQGYVPVRREMTLKDVNDHLMGYKTYGIYLLTQSSHVYTAVLDVDLKLSYRQGKLSATERSSIKRERDYLLQRIPELSQAMNLQTLVEFSGGKGYHFWYFFANPQPAELARKLLNFLAQKIKPDLSYFDLEVFPKQNQINGNSLGNLVKLPLGVHRLTGKTSYFIGYKQCSVWEQLESLKKINLISEQTLKKTLNQIQTSSAKTIIHPKYQKWAQTYPELAILKKNCTALSQIFNSCFSSKELGLREEKVLFGTIGFLTRKKLLLHYLLGHLSEYNPHLVDYKLSRLRGTPLGCKKIHDLLGLNIDFCWFDAKSSYPHPLLHCPEYLVQSIPKQEKIENLNQALAQLKISLEQVQRFLP